VARVLLGSHSARRSKGELLLGYLRHPLPIQPNFTDAFDPREHVVNRLAADAHQFRTDDARHEIARKIENFLRCRAFEPFAKDRRHGAGKCLHFRTERHANVRLAVFIHVQINAHRVCALLVFPHIDKFKVLALARLLFLRVVRVGDKCLATLIFWQCLEEIDDLV
jgi:hypothetical protein